MFLSHYYKLRFQCSAKEISKKLPLNHLAVVQGTEVGGNTMLYQYQLAQRYPHFPLNRRAAKAGLRPCTPRGLRPSTPLGLRPRPHWGSAPDPDTFSTLGSNKGRDFLVLLA